jgi:hypothetical protein
MGCLNLSLVVQVQCCEDGYAVLSLSDSIIIGIYAVSIAVFVSFSHMGIAEANGFQ